MSEFGKRLDGPGGRRTAPREPVLLTAALMSVGCSRPAILVDLSKTGTHVQLHETLGVGQQVWLKSAPVEVFGTVVWSSDGECGIAFDEPLEEEELELLRSKGAWTLRAGYSPDERLAGEDWNSGVVR
jgi:hypothetical protein